MVRFGGVVDLGRKEGDKWKEGRNGRRFCAKSWVHANSN
jgi:hypothetical protein